MTELRVTLFVASIFGLAVARMWSYVPSVTIGYDVPQCVALDATRTPRIVQCVP